MKYIAESIRKGSNAFLKRQYKGVGIFFIIMFIILFILIKFLTPSYPNFNATIISTDAKIKETKLSAFS